MHSSDTASPPSLMLGLALIIVAASTMYFATHIETLRSASSSDPGPQVFPWCLALVIGAGGFLEDDRWTERFHAPVGLDLGAENPPSIALSILAEIQAVLSGHDAGFLRDRLGRIHLPAACP